MSELQRIKTGIKACNSVMIIDGNDMCDWSWMTAYDHAMQLEKIRAHLDVKKDDWHKIVQEARQV